MLLKTKQFKKVPPHPLLLQKMNKLSPSSEPRFLKINKNIKMNKINDFL
jgi:hypothetical protein